MLLAAMAPASAGAQSGNRHPPHKKNREVAPEHREPVKTFKDPQWAPAGYHSEYHVYFPDHQAFYDPRRGYIVNDNGKWVVIPTMPLFLEQSQLSKTRIQILKDLSLDTRPELSYPRYMKMYPAAPSREPIMVPVPKATGQPGNH